MSMNMKHYETAFQNSKWNNIILENLKFVGTNNREKLQDEKFQKTFGTYDLRTALSIIISAQQNEITIEEQIQREKEKQINMDKMLNNGSASAARMDKPRDDTETESDDEDLGEGRIAAKFVNKADKDAILNDVKLNSIVLGLIKNKKFTHEDFTQEVVAKFEKLKLFMKSDELEKVFKSLSRFRFEFFIDRNAYLLWYADLLARRFGIGKDWYFSKAPARNIHEGKAVVDGEWNEQVAKEYTEFKNSDIGRNECKSTYGISEKKLKMAFAKLPYSVVVDVFILMHYHTLMLGGNMNLKDRLKIQTEYVCDMLGVNYALFQWNELEKDTSSDMDSDDEESIAVESQDEDERLADMDCEFSSEDNDDRKQFFNSGRLNKAVNELFASKKLKREDFTDELIDNFKRLLDETKILKLLSKIGQCRFENFNYRQAYLWDEANYLAREQKLDTTEIIFKDHTLHKQEKAAVGQTWHDKVFAEVNVLENTNHWQNRGVTNSDLMYAIGHFPYKMAMDIVILLQQIDNWKCLYGPDRIDINAAQMCNRLGITLPKRDETHTMHQLPDARAAGGASASAAGAQGTAKKGKKTQPNAATEAMHNIINHGGRHSDKKTSHERKYKRDTRKDNPAYGEDWAPQVLKKMTDLNMTEMISDRDIQKFLGAVPIEMAMRVLRKLSRKSTKKFILQKLANEHVAYHEEKCEWAPKVLAKLQDLDAKKVDGREMQETLGAATVHTAMKALNTLDCQPTPLDLCTAITLACPQR